MSKANKNYRYEINKCLKHPWLTRKIDSSIPITMMESYLKQDILKKFKTVNKIFLKLNLVIKHFSVFKYI